MSPRDRQTARRRLIREASLVASTNIPLIAVGLAIGSKGVAVTSLIFVALMTGWVFTRTKFRHIARFSWRLRARYAYWRAGSKDWMSSALLWAGGITPADVRTLVDDGVAPHNLSWIGEVLTDDLDRSARFAVEAITTCERPMDQIMTVLDDLLDLDAQRQEVLTYLAEDINPYLVSKLVKAKVPYSLACQIAETVETGRGQLAGMKFKAVSLEGLAGLWPWLAEHNYPPEALVDWLLVDVNVLTRSPERAAADLLKWHYAAGEDGPWWMAAGFTPDEAEAAYAAGKPLGRAALIAYAALSDPRH